MKKYLAITAALALVLTACGHAAPNSTQTLTAATETTQAMAAPAEPPQGIGSGALRMLTAAADGVYYQAFNDWEINYTDTMGRALVYAIDEQTGDARPVCSLPGCARQRRLPRMEQRQRDALLRRRGRSLPAFVLL